MPAICGHKILIRIVRERVLSSYKKFEQQEMVTVATERKGPDPAVFQCIRHNQSRRDRGRDRHR